MFNNKYPLRQIYQSTVSRMETKFREIEHIRDVPKSDKSFKLNEDKLIDVQLDLKENSHKLTI